MPPPRTCRRRSPRPARQLPITLTSPPTYRKVNPADSPILILAAHSDTLPLTTVDDFADNVVAQQISQITGVAQVIIGGEQKPAIRVQVDPAKLQTRGLTLEDVRGVLGIATTNAAKGSINGAQQSFTIAANDQLDQGGGLQRRHHRLSQRRADPRARRRPCDRRAAGRQHRGADGRQAGA